jgi:hypothetical protein
MANEIDGTSQRRMAHMRAIGRKGMDGFTVFVGKNGSMFKGMSRMTKDMEKESIGSKMGRGMRANTLMECMKGMECTFITTGTGSRANVKTTWQRAPARSSIRMGPTSKGSD